MVVRRLRRFTFTPARSAYVVIGTAIAVTGANASPGRSVWAIECLIETSADAGRAGRFGTSVRGVR
jgi:hypothetical protein